MPGIKGMTIKKSHEDSPRFAEYYKKEHPEWTVEQCEEEAKRFKRSCNYQCIIMDMIYCIFGNQTIIMIKKQHYKNVLTFLVNETNSY